MNRTRQTAILCALLLAPGLAAQAADRHVYLDTQVTPGNPAGDGVLNDCPNPAHNSKGTSNTDSLEVCQGGSNNGRLKGTNSALGRVTTCSGGSFVLLRSGMQADVDGDGTLEYVYGHPQTAVWQMAPSDSVEIHAGTYRRPGAICDVNCGLGGADNAQDDQDSFNILVAATGHGPALAAAGYIGYGTLTNPGWMRGAQMNGSTDTWDANNDLIDDNDPSRAVVFSGDANGNGRFDDTTCTATSCSGDSFFGFIWGCIGDTNFTTQGYCRPVGGHTAIKIDGDDNGTYESQPVSAVNPAHHLRVKDIKFTRFNGGHNVGNTNHNHLGMIEMSGNGSSDGGWLEHIAIVDNAVSSRPNSESFWAAVSDIYNNGCRNGHSRLFNSYLEMTNTLLFDSDAGRLVGCSWDIHDNLIEINQKYGLQHSPIQTRMLYLKNIEYLENQGKAHQRIRFRNNRVHLKDTRSVWLMDLQAHGVKLCNGTPTLPTTSCSGGQTQSYRGQVWIYGNLIWGADTLDRMWFYSDHVNSTNPMNGGDHGSIFSFNNTFDVGQVTDTAAGAMFSGFEMDEFASRNNVHLGAYEIGGRWTGSVFQYDKALNGRIGHNAIWNSIISRTGNGTRITYKDTTDVNMRDDANWTCNDDDIVAKSSRRAEHCAGVLGGGDTDDNGCVGNCDGLALDPTHSNSRTQVLANMFSAGTYPANGSAALTYFTPRVGGPLTAGASCDPDGDGVRGVDYDGDGINDETWCDLAGRRIDCTDRNGNGVIDETIDIGAIQSGPIDPSCLFGGPPDATPPTVSLTAPANNSTIFGTVAVSANASDNVGVLGVQFRLNGANLGAEDTSAPYSISWDTNTVSNGVHSLTAVARDPSGNSTTSSAVNVTVNNPDITPPNVSITAPSSGATVLNTVNITATASDNVGVIGVQFRVNGANVGPEDTAAPYSASWDTTQVVNAPYTLTAIARDAAGNTRTSAAVTVDVVNPDTIPPVPPPNVRIKN